MSENLIKFKCLLCGKLFDDSKSLNRHLKEKHHVETNEITLWKPVLKPTVKDKLETLFGAKVSLDHYYKSFVDLKVELINYDVKKFWPKVAEVIRRISTFDLIPESTSGEVDYMHNYWSAKVFISIEEIERLMRRKAGD